MKPSAVIRRGPPGAPFGAVDENAPTSRPPAQKDRDICAGQSVPAYNSAARLPLRDISQNKIESNLSPALMICKTASPIAATGIGSGARRILRRSGANPSCQPQINSSPAKYNSVYPARKATVVPKSRAFVQRDSPVAKAIARPSQNVSSTVRKQHHDSLSKKKSISANSSKIAPRTPIMTTKKSSAYVLTRCIHIW